MTRNTIAGLLLLLFSIGCKTKSTDYSGWQTYAGTKEGNRYSSNDQVNAANVDSLAVAWTFSSGDKDTGNHSQNQCNPIMIDGVLYGTSPRLTLFALDAATGQLKWQFMDTVTKMAPNQEPQCIISGVVRPRCK